MDTKVLDEIIVGRVEPHIYAFSTNTVPSSLKVGDTYRPVSVRLDEWRKYYPDLEPKFDDLAMVDEDKYFRDFSIHRFLEQEKKRTRLEAKDFPQGKYYSQEFFKDASNKDIKEAIEDIKKDYQRRTGIYQFYNAQDNLPETHTYERIENFELRPNQQKAVGAFMKAFNSGRTNLLMYAVMRFGKSFTAMCCALAMEAKIVVIVSAKADVKEEWKKTVESHDKFKDFVFLDSDGLRRENIGELRKKNKIAIFLTLQDLQGKIVKERHKELFESQIDLLIIDETHFGARAEKYGEVLRSEGKEVAKATKNKKDSDDYTEASEADKQIKKVLNAKVKLHLSGTPYRILMGSEFQKEDIIAFYQFSDIVKDKEKWDRDNLSKEDKDEWDNPYYGFPQMVRFAFNPNKSTRQKLKELNEKGFSFAFSALLRPKSLVKTDDGQHKQFENEKEILELLEVIDGCKEDQELLGFLDYKKIKSGKMCRHIVMVLPFCASCDAMEALIEKQRQSFKNLSKYEILNISGWDLKKQYSSSARIKRAIAEFEEGDKKTLTLTVNRMLTGSTVKEWDTMFFLKDTTSPQEYDQAIFRLQNQYTKKYIDDKGNVVVRNMKPQTLLVDFMPNRMFYMQELKAQIYNVNVDSSGNSMLSKRIEDELRISPIITLNKDKLVQVEPNNVLEAVRNYQKDRGIKEEALALPVDLKILDDSKVKKVFDSENEIGSKQGLSLTPHLGDGDDLSTSDSKTTDDSGAKESQNTQNKENEKEVDSWKKKIQNYYVRILLFAFLTEDKVISLQEIIGVLENGSNKRIAKNLGLEKFVLEKIQETYNPWALSKMDYSIQDMNSLSESADIETAFKKFGKLGDAIVFTPENIANEMVGLFPKELFMEAEKNESRFLDIAGNTGEFANVLYEKLKHCKVSDNYIKNAIYTIPKSPICYELTRKIYKLLGLNEKNISTFYSTDLLKIKKRDDVDYDKIRQLLLQNKEFDTIILKDVVDDKGDKAVKFDAVVGNPPYQEKMEATSDNPIYNIFMDASYRLSPLVSLITPARFLFNSGKTPKAWNQKMLSDEHLKIVRYEAQSQKIFPNVDIKGGVAISLRDANTIFGAIGIFTEFKEESTVLKKIETTNYESLSSLVFAPESYRFTDKLHQDFPFVRNLLSAGHLYDITSNIFEKLDENILQLEKPKEGSSVQVLGRLNNERTSRWIYRKYICDHPNLDFYKVFLAKSNGSGQFGETLSTPMVVGPNVAHTQTFLSIGAYKTQFEAESLLRYIKTKFARMLLSILKKTQDNKKSVWKYVPLQDFTVKSDIDWTLSISEIDRQLYKKYCLSCDEINFIEANVQSMN